MRYQDSRHFTHTETDRVGVLITNLGTPDEPTTPALRRYLREFLWDPRVVEAPRPLWWLILNGIILTTRPKRSAAAYRTVWTEKGSPLLLHTRRQAEALTQALATAGHQNLVVDFAMRYGNPSISSVVQRMMEQGVRRLLVLPLYPQYSASTTASTFDALSRDFRRRRWLPELRFITHYHDYPPFIAALVASIQEHWAEHGRADRLILSYHGVPLSYLHEGDPYFCECHKTTRLVAEALGLQPNEYLTTFQSRFGSEEWLQPYTDDTMKGLPGQGVKSVQVVCPGFSADCLETIEEIGQENRDYFLQAGGERYEYIPALNQRADHIAALAQLISQNLTGWSGAEAGERAQRDEGAPREVADNQRLARAAALGAEK